jgi:hypothetical protein
MKLTIPILIALTVRRAAIDALQLNCQTAYSIFVKHTLYNPPK